MSLYALFILVYWDHQSLLFSDSQLVFGTQALVSWVSKFCTIKPGDIILTGTPPGVGIFKNPPEFLQVTLIWSHNYAI
jgi:2-keto-4-pentenoate hydratase/2-oxohepta-3-ene-1,7-dioic acid hydratase in catechol pathway